MSNIDYSDVVTGAFRALRLWRDFDTSEWVIDAERLDGTISTQEWSYTSLAKALADVPLLHAVLIQNVVITPLDSPAGWWQVSCPIPVNIGEGHEVTRWPSKSGAEDYLLGWVK